MITAVVLTHNNAPTLARTLESIIWADELVVIDDYSTDDTRDIAKKYKTHIFQHHLNNDFAQQRNFGLSKARGDWILFVDSDEVVSEALKKEIVVITNSTEKKNLDEIPRQARDDNASSMNGYYVRRQDFFQGKQLRYGETANVKLLRLAKKDAGVWEEPVHEIWKISGEVGELTHPILHDAHPNVSQFLDEINTYSTLRAQFLYQKKISVNMFDIVGYPAAKFIVNYWIRLGFLDGMPGMVMAVMMSFHSFLVRAKLWQLWDKQAA